MIFHHQKEISQQTGFSLIEIMVALTISLTLIAGVIPIFTKNKQLYRYQETSSRIQENGRIAIDFLNKIIRMTDFSGCSRSNQVVSVLNYKDPANPKDWDGADWWKNFGSTGVAFGDEFLSLVGFDGDQAFPAETYSSGSFKKDRIPGTDAIISLGGSGGYIITGVDTVSNPRTFTLSSLYRSLGAADLERGKILDKSDLVMVCNLQITSIFQVKQSITLTNTISYQQDLSANPDPKPGNFINTLGATPHTSNSTMMDYVPSAFYIGKSISETTKSLYQLRFDGASMERAEIIEGVENMQIHYGVDLDGDQIIDQYFDATNVPDWSRVRNVRIQLLLTNYLEGDEDKEFEKDEILTQPQIYIFPNDKGDAAIIGRGVQAPDLRVYQVFSTTIGIRNRIR